MANKMFQSIYTILFCSILDLEIEITETNPYVK